MIARRLSLSLDASVLGQWLMMADTHRDAPKYPEPPAADERKAGLNCSLRQLDCCLLLPCWVSTRPSADYNNLICTTFMFIRQRFSTLTKSIPKISVFFHRNTWKRQKQCRLTLIQNSDCCLLCYIVIMALECSKAIIIIHEPSGLCTVMVDVISFDRLLQRHNTITCEVSFHTCIINAFFKHQLS